ncbi:hypothetical protein AB205_0210900 [Aquarana catesbeiana]|uniref:Uncharacterized protein n=1 Tax=Aquarana catesbeiana TaxID=8400 RepID=A0A2G9RCJ6_AQUCT|nr:hypothetical protein AB205_0210900 [Aquarana catesbeiana]
MSSAWNSAKTDNCTPLPSNVSYSYFWPQISVCFCFSLIGEKRLGTSEDNRNLPPPKEGEQRTQQPQDVEQREVEEVVEFVSTTGDVHVVDEHFISPLKAHK